MHKINAYSWCICLMLIANELVECIQWMHYVSPFSELILGNAYRAGIVSISNTSLNIINLKIKLILYVASVGSLLSCFLFFSCVFLPHFFSVLIVSSFFNIISSWFFLFLSSFFFLFLHVFPNLCLCFFRYYCLFFIFSSSFVILCFNFFLIF